jgi:hypothetical protein
MGKEEISSYLVTKVVFVTILVENQSYTFFPPHISTNKKCNRVCTPSHLNAKMTWQKRCAVVSTSLFSGASPCTLSAMGHVVTFWIAHIVR